MHDHSSHSRGQQWLGRARTVAAAMAHRIKSMDADTPLLTGVVLTAVTLCAASTCVWMLPITGRSSASKAPFTSREDVAARAAAAAAPAPTDANPAPLAPAASGQFAAAHDTAAPLDPPSAAPVHAQAHRSLHRLAMATADVPHQVKVEWTDATPSTAAATAPASSATDSGAWAIHAAQGTRTLPPTANAPAPSSTVPAEREASSPYPKRIVYLVDDSGSLLDSLPRVIKWLGDRLDQLKRDQQFTVMFFRHGQIIEAPPAGLKNASFAAKVAVWTWMQPDAGHVAPQGRSDLLAAIRAALRYDAQKIVILSDDNVNRLVKADAATDASGGAAILDEIAAILRGRSVHIDTVQFYYRDQAGAFEAIADRFGGRYTFVRPVSKPTGPDIAPLIELSIAR